MGNSPQAEVEVTEDSIRALLRAEAPMIADRPLTFVGSGWDNEMWRLGADLVVRLPRRAASAELVAHEAWALSRLSGTDSLFPRVIVDGAARPGLGAPWRWLVLSWAPGSSALTLPRAERQAWAPSLAQAIDVIHAVDPTGAPDNPVRGVPLAVRDGVMQARLAALSLHDADVLARAWRAGLLAESHTGAPVVVHGDLHPGNIIASPHELTAVIDFGDVTAGDPAVDLATAWLTFERTGREQFRAALSRHPDATWVRARAWAAIIAAALLESSSDRSDLLLLGQETVAELLADER